MNARTLTESKQVLLERLRAHFVGVGGIIRDLVDITPIAGAPRIFNSACTLSDTSQIIGAKIPGSAGAAGFTKEDALISGIGEAVERYAAAVVPWEKLIHASETKLDGKAIGMDQFHLYTDDVYSKQGFPVARYDKELPIYWREAISLVSGESRFLPAAHLYVPYLYQDKSKTGEFVSMATSTGQACHTDLGLARLSGLYECIERDAFMITWIRKLTPRKLAIDSHPGLAELYRQCFANCQVEFNLYDLTLDITVPTVLCVAVSKSARGPLAVIGCATRLNVADACEKALLESAQCLAWAHHMCETLKDWRPAPGYTNIHDFQDHVRLYCEPDMIQHLDFLLNIKEEHPVPPSSVYASVAEQVDTVVQKIVAQGFDVFEVDMTIPELSSADLHALKMVVPGLVSLTAAHIFPALASPRFYSVPEKLGLTCGVAGFNPIPHPFP